MSAYSPVEDLCAVRARVHTAVIKIDRPIILFRLKEMIGWAD